MEHQHLHQQNQDLKTLNTIAHQLNQEVALRAALQTSLQHTIQLLDLNSGWIWLVHPHSQSVYLAASYDLPPAFTQHPERLSGWCYCIEKYLTDRMDTTVNVSEISCSRLKDVVQGTAGLRYHASIPLFSGKEKVGIMNVLSAKTHELADTQLQLLHTIGELLSMAVQRTQLYEQSKAQGAIEERQRINQGLGEQLLPKLDRLILKLQAAQLPNTTNQANSKDQSLKESEKLALQLMDAVQEMQDTLQDLADVATSPPTPLRYPGPPLSPREKEVLNVLEIGKTNKQIADQLFISERTVKFHVSAILQKLEASNRTEAVQIARQMGLLND